MENAPPTTFDARTAGLVAAAKRQWERTFDAIIEPLMVVDDDFVVRRANLALADDLSTAVQRLVGRRCYETRRESPRSFGGPAGQPCEGCPVLTARQGDGACEGELKTATQRVYRLRAYPFEDEAGQRLTVCSYRDVTEERQLSRQLISAEKLASIGRLAAGVAHEINNPLGGILAFTQILMKEQPQDEEDRRECLAEIERSALRCKAVVESLLRFSRQSPNDQVGPVSANDVVRTALRLASYRMSLDGLELVTHAGPVAAAGAGRRRPAGAGGAEPGHQRRRQRARGAPATATGASRSRTSVRRRRGGAGGAGQRPGHRRRRPGQAVRSLLHHQGGGAGHRAGPGGHLRHREGARRPHRRPHPPRGGRGVHGRRWRSPGSGVALGASAPSASGAERSTRPGRRPRWRCAAGGRPAELAGQQGRPTDSGAAQALVAVGAEQRAGGGAGRPRRRGRVRGGRRTAPRPPGRAARGPGGGAGRRGPGWPPGPSRWRARTP